jgi:hypothetical protein
MTQAIRSLLAFALLLISGAFGSAVQSAHGQRAAAEGIDWKTLEKHYQQIWDSVPGKGQTKVPVPSLVVHLGASAGNRISVWAKSENGRMAAERDWVLDCPGADAVSVKEEVHDPQFGVSLLTLTRNDGNAAPLPCTLKMGGSDASLVVPVLSPPPDQRRFSFLAYSCNEPFTTKDRKGILARDLSLWLRMDARATGENSRGQLPERPQFVLGVGDQIYVDPDADAKGTERLSFFTGKRSDEFLIKKDANTFFGALNVVYRYNFSLPPLARALSKLPSYMMWDDHEIRDGWGSQGDELTNRDMIAYFRVARHAFIAHQLLRSYAPGEIGNDEYKALVRGSKTLHHQFSHGERTHVLMLDARSERASGNIFEDTARKHVQDWLARGRKDQGDLYVLAVGTPLFPSRTHVGTLARKLEPEIKDDVLDGWDSDLNKHSRAELLKMLADHFGADKQDRLLVISGDVHYSSLYFLSLNNRVVGHEVVTSGIAHSLPREGSSFNWLLDSGNTVGQFGVRPAGKINDSASFAELIVDLGEKPQPPKVDLVFHLNGTRVKGGVALGNTNLLVTRDRPLWYHTYRYDYRDPLEHQAAARREAYPVGDIPAGSIMPLPLELPPVRTRRRLILLPFGRNVVQSAIQGQSVFCFVKDTKYNSELALSWDLNELKDNCTRLALESR